MSDERTFDRKQPERVAVANNKLAEAALQTEAKKPIILISHLPSRSSALVGLGKNRRAAQQACDKSVLFHQLNLASSE